jgi:hypothetical protein
VVEGRHADDRQQADATRGANLDPITSPASKKCPPHGRLHGDAPLDDQSIRGAHDGVLLLTVRVLYADGGVQLHIVSIGSVLAEARTGHHPVHLV